MGGDAANGRARKRCLCASLPEHAFCEREEKASKESQKAPFVSLVGTHRSSATLNNSLTSFGPSPRYFCTSSLPTTRRNVALVLLATALASSVLPVPGSPYSTTPLGGLMPMSSYLRGEAGVSGERGRRRERGRAQILAAGNGTICASRWQTELSSASRPKIALSGSPSSLMARSLAPRLPMARSADNTAAPFVHTCVWPRLVRGCYSLALLTARGVRAAAPQPP